MAGRTWQQRHLTDFEHTCIPEYCREMCFSVASISWFPNKRIYIYPVERGDAQSQQRFVIPLHRGGY